MKKTIFFPILIAFLILMATASFAANYTSKTLSKHKTGEYKVDLKYPYLTGTTNLDKTVNKYINDTITHCSNFIINLAKSKQDYQQAQEYFTVSDFAVSISDANIFSGYIRISEYTGGAHPDTATKTMNYFNMPNKKVKEISYKDILKSDKTSLENLDDLLITKINAEKKSKEIEELITSIDPALYDSFIIEPNGIRWIFDPYGVGAYYEGIYEIFIDWKELSSLLIPSQLTELSDIYVNKVRISGIVAIDDAKSVPSNAVCRISLAKAFTDTSNIANIIQLYEIPFKDNSIPFDVMFFYKNLDKNGEYVVRFDILYDNIIEYTNENTIPVSYYGWTNDTPIVLQNVNTKIKAEKKYEDLGYVRFSGTAYYLERMLMPPDSYLEFRIMDKDKIYAKKFTHFQGVPADFDITFPAKNMTSEKEYGFIVLLRNGEDTLFKSDIYYFTKSNWQDISNDIRLIRSIK